MIKEDSYTAEWLLSHRSKAGLSKINPPLAEKMIYALTLVEQLAANKLDFIFKGGTSLILLLNDAGRFSIDIDILTTASRQQIESVLQQVCAGKPFTRFELNGHRSYKQGIPKAHYRLFYTSALSKKEDHILLDILFEEHAYPALMDLPVKAEWLLTDDNHTLVKVPTIESIAGDKLTAFAPLTTGILYGKGKEVEIIKQLHDVDKLYNQINDMGVLIKSFNGVVAKEIKYRGKTCNANDVINDIVATGLLIIRREKNTQDPDKSYFGEIKRGLLQFKSYQTTSAFRIDEAIVAAGKAAMLAAKIQTGNTLPLPRFQALLKKSDLMIQQPEFSYLNKLPAEALFYWHHVINLLYPLTNPS